MKNYESLRVDLTEKEFIDFVFNYKDNGIITKENTFYKEKTAIFFYGMYCEVKGRIKYGKELKTVDIYVNNKKIDMSEICDFKHIRARFMENYEREWGDGCIRRLNSTLIGLARLAILEAKTVSKK